MTAGSAARRVRWEQQQRIYRRRRVLALIVGVVLFALLVRGCSALVGGDSGEEASQAAAPPELPRGGRLVLPSNRVVAYYGAPQDPELGVLGETSPEVAARKLAKEGWEDARPGRPALPALELISTLAQSAPGEMTGSHRLRQSAATIRRHLGAARAIKGLLVLDVQPGQADFVEEVQALGAVPHAAGRRARAGPGMERSGGNAAGQRDRLHGCGGRERGLGLSGTARASPRPPPEAADRASVHRRHGDQSRSARPPGRGSRW